MGTLPVVSEVTATTKRGLRRGPGEKEPGSRLRFQRQTSRLSDAEEVTLVPKPVLRLGTPTRRDSVSPHSHYSVGTAVGPAPSPARRALPRGRFPAFDGVRGQPVSTRRCLSVTDAGVGTAVVGRAPAPPVHF